MMICTPNSLFKERFLISWKSLGGPGWSRYTVIFALFSVFFNKLKWLRIKLFIFFFPEDLEEGIFSLMTYYDFEMENESATMSQSTVNGKTLWGLDAAIVDTMLGKVSISSSYM